MVRFGKGWYLESYRHSLAAKGIRTSFIQKDLRKKVLDIIEQKYGKELRESMEKEHVGEEPVEIEIKHYVPRSEISELEKKNFEEMMTEVKAEMARLIPEEQKNIAKLTDKALSGLASEDELKELKKAGVDLEKQKEEIKRGIMPYKKRLEKLMQEREVVKEKYDREMERIRRLKEELERERSRGNTNLWVYENNIWAAEQYAKPYADLLVSLDNQIKSLKRATGENFAAKRSYMANIGVVGSRRSNELQKEILEGLLAQHTKDTIVSGGCYAGADKWAEEFADKHNVKKVIYLPSGHRPQDFHARNSLIVQDSDELIATIPENPNPARFAGTEQTVREAIKKGIPTTLIDPKGKIFKYNMSAKRPRQIDLKRYAGTWEQVSVKPVPWFQKKCSDKKVTAIYRLRKDGKVDVINKCGKDVAKGVARSVSKDNSKLKVSFIPFGLFEGDYNIVQLDNNYKNVTVKGGNTTWKLRKVK